jgi:hypothetical protein
MATKLAVFRSCVLPCLYYCAHLCSLRIADERRLDIFVRKRLRRLFGIRWQDKISTIELMQRVKAAHGKTWTMPSEDLRRFRLKAFGHFCRHDNIARQAMLADGKRQRGRPKARLWRDVIPRDLVALGFQKFSPEECFVFAQNRDCWKSICKAE